MQNDFTTYLAQNRLIPKTIKRMLYCANHYLLWLQSSQIDVAAASYKDLLDYIEYLQQNKSKQVTNEHLRAVSHYYSSLQLPDIAYQVRVRGIPKPQNILFTEEEHNHIYHSYTSKSQQGFWRYSDKILLGLRIYQALDNNDIARIELQHLNLQTGQLYVPGGSRKKASRTLDLAAHQILPLHHYIEHHRDTRTEKLIKSTSLQY